MLQFYKMYRSQQLDNQLIKDSFKEYLVESPPQNLQYVPHCLIPNHSFQCFIRQRPVIGYYQILNSHNYFSKLQEALLLKSLNQKGVFVEFIGVWLEEQTNQSLILYILFQKLQSSIKQLFTNSYDQDVFWRCLVDVSEGMGHLVQKNLNHGSFNFYSLLTKGQEVKIFYFPGMRTSLGIWEDSEDDMNYLFLSPEEIRAHKTNNRKIDSHKSDIFNLGMILITLLMSQNEDIFGNQNVLQKKLSQIQSRIGFNVYFILQKMTRMQEKQRIQWYQIQPFVSELSGGTQNKTSRMLDFRQGTFQRTFDSNKNPINEKLRKSSSNFNKKRRLIFQKSGTHKNKRNLLQSEGKNKSDRPQIITNEGCMTAHCYLKM